jgi:hypothetical protein
MSIDELLHETMIDEVTSAPVATAAAWAVVEERSMRLRRTRHRRRRAAVALGVAAAVLVGVVVVGLSNRSTPSPTDNLLVGNPSTTVTPATGLAPAANVEATVPLPSNPGPGDVLPPEPWISARQGRTDSELVVYLMGERPGECGADYAAVVETQPDRVVVTMTPVRSWPTDPAVSCTAIKLPAVRRAFLVELPEPRRMRQLVDGVDPTTPKPAESTTILQAPAALPTDMTPQTEWLEGAWSVCYAATTTLCSPRLIAGATVATIQAPGLGSIIDELGIPVGDKLASPPDNRNGIAWLEQHWIWPDPSTPPFVQLTVHGRPALLFDRSGTADRLGDTVVVWTEGSAPDIDDTVFALGVSEQMGLTGEQVVALAESMRPTG